jgi:hypothetical protein
MIEALEGPKGMALNASLAPGTVAYVDADWLPPGRAGPVPGIVVDDGIDADERGVLPLVRLSRQAIALLDGATRSVRVEGVGLVAEMVRRAVADHGVGSIRTTRPTAIVDLTGDPERIIEATRLVGDLGTIVLAGESLGRRLDLDLYADVHSRGLTIRGVSTPSNRLFPDAVQGDRHAVAPPALVRAGGPIPTGALWYRVEPADE